MTTESSHAFTSEQEIENAIAELIEESDWDFRRISTFEDAGLLTNDRGIVIRMSEDVMIQLTIVAYYDSTDSKMRLPSISYEEYPA